MEDARDSFLCKCDMDCALIRFLCLSRWTEKLIELSPIIMGPSSSSSEFFSKLLSDRVMLEQHHLIGGQRIEAAKQYLILFANLALRPSSIETKAAQASSTPTRQCVPPALLCSTLIMAARCVTEEIAGKFITLQASGSRPWNHMTTDFAEMYLRSVSHALARIDNGESYRHKSQCRRDDVFPASLSVLEKTIASILEWKAAAAGYRKPQPPQLDKETGPSATGTLDRASLAPLDDAAIEALFQDVLSLPSDPSKGGLHQDDAWLFESQSL